HSHQRDGGRGAIDADVEDPVRARSGDGRARTRDGDVVPEVEIAGGALVLAGAGDGEGGIDPGRDGDRAVEAGVLVKLLDRGPKGAGAAGGVARSIAEGGAGRVAGVVHDEVRAGLHHAAVALDRADLAAEPLRARLAPLIGAAGVTEPRHAGWDGV